jgi:hypothetical protein
VKIGSDPVMLVVTMPTNFTIGFGCLMTSLSSSGFNDALPGTFAPYFQFSSFRTKWVSAVLYYDDNLFSKKFEWYHDSSWQKFSWELKYLEL